jgi:hypothetical protein
LLDLITAEFLSFVQIKINKMKKLLLSLFVVTALVSSSFAQLSLKAGVNFANQSAESGGISIDPSSRIGYLIGVNFAANVTESIVFRPGIQFTLKGSKIEFAGSDISSNFNYVEVPLDLVYNFNDLSIHAGPYLGLLMSATSEGDDIKEFVKTADLGINIGAGFSFSHFGVGINYGLGLSNINDDSMDDTNVKNKVINIYVTYTL